MNIASESKSSSKLLLLTKYKVFVVDNYKLSFGR